MSLFLLFVTLSVVNVILQTIKSIVTIKCGKMASALVNAVAYGLYTVLLVYTNCELPLWSKALVTAGANFGGVYIVKWFEEKSKRDKLWKVEFITSDKNLWKWNVPFYLTAIDEDTKLVTLFLPSKNDSRAVNKLLKEANVKCFVTEQNAEL